MRTRDRRTRGSTPYWREAVATFWHAWQKLFFSAVVALALGLLFASAPTASAEVGTTPDEGTVQTNGRVYSVVNVGDRIYLGGNFTYVNGVPRSRLAAVDASTGQLTDWDPRASTVVRALAASPDGSRIYAGGNFKSINGVQGFSHVATIDAATGAVDPNWKPQVDLPVRALATLDSRVYLGGDFLTINGQIRKHLAAIDGITGELDPRWHPDADATVRTLVPSSNGFSIYAGGDFTEINGRTRPYLAALNPDVGHVRAWRPAIDPNGIIWDLEVSGTHVYTAEGGRGGAIAAYDRFTGARTWRNWGDGDFQGVAILGDKVYAGGHFETVGGEVGIYVGRVPRRFLAAFDAATGTLDSQWLPSETNAQVWIMESNPLHGRIYAGGEFTSISGQQHQGFAQFSEQAPVPEQEPVSEQQG